MDRGELAAALWGIASEIAEKQEAMGVLVGWYREADASWHQVAMVTGLTAEGARKKWGP